MGNVQTPGEELNLKKYKAIIFDFDGTLYDFSHVAINLILSRPKDLFRLHAERTARRLLKGQWFGGKEPYERVHRDFMFQSKGGFSSPEEALDWYKGPCLDNMVKVLSKKYHARPFAKEVFSILKEYGVKTCVFSDYIRTADRMSAIGLANTADFTINSEDLGGLKPSVKVFETLARILGCKPGEILMVGDREDTDGAGALKSGMDFVRIGTAKTAKYILFPSTSYRVMLWDDFASLVKRTFPQKQPA